MLLANRFSAQSLRLMMATSSFLMMLYVWNDSRLSRTYTARSLHCSRDNSRFDHSTSGEPEQDDFDIKDILKGPPTTSLFDNLRSDTLYITAFMNAGFTKDVQATVNMIYLGILTGRIPIIPPHSARHIGKEAGIFPFGEIFDLPRLRKELNYPMVEWRDLKNGSHLDHIGCWSQGMASTGNGGRPRDPYSPTELHLDISYTAVPTSSRIQNGFHSFGHFARLGYPGGWKEAIREPITLASPKDQIALLPNSHLMCFDDLYYVASWDAFEWEKEWSPAWNLVGKHLHWHPRLLHLGQYYAKKALGVAEDAPLPKFISLHLRHGDSKRYCDGQPDTCFPQISEAAQVVKEVQADVLAKLGVSLLPEHVLVTSDETDPAWWSSILAQGWKYVNHTEERTIAHYGRWLPVFIDAMIQSMGTGFVGTAGSTMSLIAGRRVEVWNGGVVRMARMSANAYPASPGLVEAADKN